MSKAIYAALRAHCEAEGVAISHAVEMILHTHIAGIPAPTAKATAKTTSPAPEASVQAPVSAPKQIVVFVPNATPRPPARVVPRVDPILEPCHLERCPIVGLHRRHPPIKEASTEEEHAQFRHDDEQEEVAMFSELVADGHAARGQFDDQPLELVKRILAPPRDRRGR